jgi:hypothetical protein
MMLVKGMMDYGVGMPPIFSEILLVRRVLVHCVLVLRLAATFFFLRPFPLRQLGNEEPAMADTNESIRKANKTVSQAEYDDLKKKYDKLVKDHDRLVQEYYDSPILR